MIMIWEKAKERKKAEEKGIKVEYRDLNETFFLLNPNTLASFIFCECIFLALSSYRIINAKNQLPWTWAPVPPMDM